MALGSWTRAWPRWLVPMLLLASPARTARADDARVAVWIDTGTASDAQARERAFRLELEARGIVLLRADPPLGDAQSPTSTWRAAFARQTLAQSDADAVLWLEGDPQRPVSWLRVVHAHSDAVEQAPLPHPPEAIAPELFAIAAASLLEQVLREQAGPGVEPPAAAVAPAAAVVVPAAEPTIAAKEPVAAPSAPAPHPAPPTRRAASAPAEVADDWFVQAGLVLSLAHVHAGMEAATRPTRDQVFTETDGRFFFDLDSPWVPDRDSFDDFEDEALGIPRGVTPAPGTCSADGVATGPPDLNGPDGEPFRQLEPSRYCARVDAPGFALVPALRVVFGRWVLPELAVGVLYQGHFGIDADSFLGNQLFGVHAEYAVLGERRRGLSLSLLGELTVGRTETPVPSPAPGGPRVNALSGPLGAQAGALLRAWPTRSFALLLGPTLGLRFPDGQLLVDGSAGAEVPF